MEVVGDAQSTGYPGTTSLNIETRTDVYFPSCSKRDTDSGKLTEVDNGSTDM